MESSLCGDLLYRNSARVDAWNCSSGNAEFVRVNVGVTLVSDWFYSTCTPVWRHSSFSAIFQSTGIYLVVLCLDLGMTKSSSHRFGRRPWDVTCRPRRVAIVPREVGVAWWLPRTVELSTAQKCIQPSKIVFRPSRRQKPRTLEALQYDTPMSVSEDIIPMVSE